MNEVPIGTAILAAFLVINWIWAPREFMYNHIFSRANKHLNDT